MGSKGKLVIKKLIILSVISLLIFLFGFFPNAVLNYYSLSFYPIISSGLRFISSLFPFAIGDIIYAILIGFVLYKIIHFVKNRKQLKKEDRITVPLQVFSFILILYIVFKLVWGLNYSRPSVSQQLAIGNKKYSVKELVLLGGFFVNKTNALKLKQGKIPNYTIQDLRQKSTEAYQLMESKNSLFRYNQPCLKPVLSPYIISKSGIEGYYTPLSGEANMNMNLPNFVKPYVACHEIAHQLGIAYEDEANLLGYLTANNSPDINYQYAANYEMLRYILFEIALKSPDDYKLLKAKLNQGILDDFKTEKEFWRGYNGDMFKYMDTAFDSFLKLNNQKKGINSYQDIVIWLWNIYKSESLKSASPKP